MTIGVVYNLATGMILSRVQAPDEHGVEIQIMGKEDTLGVLFEDADMATQYVVGGQLATRPQMSLTCAHDLSQPITLAKGEVFEVKGLMEGTTVIHPDGYTTVDDGYIDWGSDTAGEYQLHFVKAPYQEVTINAIVG